MFSMKRLAAAAAAAALVATPTLAAAAPAPAASLSVAKTARATAPAGKGASRIAAGPSATLINIGILAALVAGVLVATDGGGDDSDSN